MKIFGKLLPLNTNGKRIYL